MCKYEASGSIFHVDGSYIFVKFDFSLFNTSMILAFGRCRLASVMHCLDQNPVVRYIAFLYGFKDIKFFTTHVY